MEVEVGATTTGAMVELGAAAVELAMIDEAEREAARAATVWLVLNDQFAESVALFRGQ